MSPTANKKDKKLQPDERDELLALYQVSSTDLAYFKQAQWNIVNYGILALAGLVASSAILETIVLKCVFLVLVALVSGISLYLLRELESKIRIRRARQDYCRERFGEEFKKAWKSKDITTTEKDQDIGVFVLLIGATIVAMILAILILSTNVTS